jgi:hypothetical protein
VRRPAPEDLDLDCHLVTRLDDFSKIGVSKCRSNGKLLTDVRCSVFVIRYSLFDGIC